MRPDVGDEIKSGEPADLYRDEEKSKAEWDRMSTAKPQEPERACLMIHGDAWAAFRRGSGWTVRDNSGLRSPSSAERT